MASWAQGAPNEALKDQSQIQFLIQYFKQGQEGDTLIAKAPVICKQIRGGLYQLQRGFPAERTGNRGITILPSLPWATGLPAGQCARQVRDMAFEDPGLRLSAPGSAPVWAAAPNADGDPVVQFCPVG